MSNPSGSDMAKAFLHLALVHFIFHTSIDSDPQSYSKQKLVVILSPSAGLEHLYQAANDLWEKEGSLVNQLPSLQVLSPVFLASFRTRVLSTRWESLLLLHSCQRPHCLWDFTPVWTEVLAHRKQADLLSTQNLHLQSCMEELQSSPLQDDASSTWALMYLLLTNAATALHSLVCLH